MLAISLLGISRAASNILHLASKPSCLAPPCYLFLLASYFALIRAACLYNVNESGGGMQVTNCGGACALLACCYVRGAW
jgi:hypothetical protein